MSEIKFKKLRRKLERKTTTEDSDEEKSDDESTMLVSLGTYEQDTDIVFLTYLNE